MLGYNTMREVSVWVQFEKEMNLQFVYYNVNGIKKHQTSSYRTSNENSNVAHFIAKDLEPGTEYSYQILMKNDHSILTEGTFTTQALWQHRKDPPNFSFATGSCTYVNQKEYDRPGEPYGKGLSIFQHIDSLRPSFMLWLGDNIYLREPDWSSKSGIYQRYTHFKAQPELQDFWKNTHHYAIWDDHDYGPNDADRSFVNKDISLQAFKDFWANPSYGVNGKRGITSQFSFNDLDFFLLDNRYFRSPNKRLSGTREILGKEQIDWLIDALVNSKASFKFIVVGGQFLSPAAVHENHATFNVEREFLLDLIQKEKLKNIVFLSGDRHKTELTKMELDSGLVVYDYTCSPLASKAYNTSEEGNTLRMQGTHVDTQNFGFLSLNGTYENRELSIHTYDAEGKLIWKRKIKKQ